MQWEFRKALENFDAYKSYSQGFIAQVDRGEPGVLDMIVREMKLILEDSSEKIYAKVLAMRVSIK